MLEFTLCIHDRCCSKTFYLFLLKFQQIKCIYKHVSSEAEIQRPTLIWILMSFTLKLPGSAVAYQSEKCSHFISQELLGHVTYSVTDYIMKTSIVPTFTENLCIL